MAWADNQLPTEGLVAMYKSAKRPENLGNVAFVVQAAKGYETTAQQPLTLEELRTRSRAPAERK